MRKLLIFNMVTLDGYFEGPNGEIDWHVVDEEFNEFTYEQLNSIDLLIFGRVTYGLMASYWPTPSAATDDPLIADRMNRLPKIVFSRSLANAAWQNTTLIKADAASEISKIKQLPGKDLIIFGSSNLASTFIQYGLIDEYRIMLNPVLLGGGIPLFNGIKEKLDLKLLKTRTFRSGNVLLYYQPARRSL